MRWRPGCLQVHLQAFVLSGIGPDVRGRKGMGHMKSAKRFQTKVGDRLRRPVMAGPQPSRSLKMSNRLLVM